MKFLEPHYQLPSDKCFDTINVSEGLVFHVSVTTDVWNSVAQDSYISLTCHYITADFIQQQVRLHAALSNDHHIGEHIRAMIKIPGV